MQEICSSKPVVTGICDPNKSWAWHHCSLKLGLKLKYLIQGFPSTHGRVQRKSGWKYYIPYG